MDYPDSDVDEFELMHAQEFELMNELEDEVDPVSVEFTRPKSKRSLNFESSGNSKKKNSPELEIPDKGSNQSQQLLESSLLAFPNELTTNNQPTVEDIFGDINDIDFNEHINKRPRLDGNLTLDQKKDILIKKILDERNQTTCNNRVKHVANKSEFRETEVKNSVSKKVPNWPFMSLTDTNHQRFYFRLRSEEFMDNEAKRQHFNVGSIGLFEMKFEELKKMAFNEVLNKKQKERNKENIDIEEPEKELWVERYKPKSYFQLLSDESTNRALLYWLKQWDKIVFQRDPPGRRGQEVNEVNNKERWQSRVGDKFSSQNSGWKSKSDIPDLVFQMDEHGRPYYKIAMLCGPPGLGKTTLAHMLARQAGYNVVEVNASDDRTVQAFRTQLEAATQMKAVMGVEPKPNCLILDEIDGAPQPSIDFLVKFAGDKNDSKSRKNTKKRLKGLLKRPIICICNDVYVPSLRPLRQIAYTLNVPQTSSARLGERLMEITRKEDISTDLGTMMALSEKTNNDIRSCLSFLHCLKSNEKSVTLAQVHSCSIGSKDTQQGLFSVWQTIFHYKISKASNALTNKRPIACANSETNFSDVGLQSRLKNVRKTVQSFGDYERVALGVFENFLRIKTIDSSMNSIVKGSRWFCFFDIISKTVQSTQMYSLYPYMVYPFLAWHLQFSSINWPKLIYPHINYEVFQKSQRNRQVLQFALMGMPAHIQAYEDKEKLMLDIIPYLIELIVPSIRPVSIQLYTSKEKAEVERVTNVMADYNLSYTQERTAEGSYHYKLDPDIEEVGLFGERERSRIFSYTGKQMVSREVEAEKLRRLSVKLSTGSATGKTSQNSPKKRAHEVPPIETKDDKNSLPNHLQKLTPKALKKRMNLQHKDFFGRVVSSSLEKEISQAKTDDIVKSDVWFHFKEGYNNAVRKNVLISELL